MNKLLAFAFLLVSLSMLGCPKPSPTPFPPNSPDPNPYIDAATSPETTPHEFTCADVCKHGFDLNCAFAQPTPNGATCLDVCKNIQTSGVISWNLACRSMANSCPAIDACK